MKVSLEIPWQRYALIAELAKRLEGRCPQFGKTALQKMVYLLQEVYHIDCGYDFELYTYGPFASKLLQDLDLVEHIDGVTVHPVNSLMGGYVINPGEKFDVVRKKGLGFLDRQDVEKAISSLVDDFGDYSAKDLELRSTIIYVQRDFMRQGRRPSADEVNHIVKQVKPKFSDHEIRAAVDELKQKNYIELN